MINMFLRNYQEVSSHDNIFEMTQDKQRWCLFEMKTKIIYITLTSNGEKGKLIKILNRLYFK